MGKNVYLPGLALLSGILGLGLRLWQRRVSFDPETLLFLSGCPAPALLLALTAVVAAVLLVSLRRESPPKTAAEVLACPSTLYMTLMAAGALLMLVGGALSVQEGLYQLTVWRVDPAAEPVTYPIALLLCALFSFLSGPALLMLGRESYRGPITQKAGPWSLAQPAAGLAWLFATHLKHGTDPVLMDYGPALAAVAFLMLGSYELAALRYAHPHPRRGLFCCLMSVYLGLLSLGDSLEPFRLALAAAFLLSNLAGAMALLNHMGPVRSGGARLAPKKEINNEGDHNNGE